MRRYAVILSGKIVYEYGVRVFVGRNMPKATLLQGQLGYVVLSSAASSRDCPVVVSMYI